MLKIIKASAGSGKTYQLTREYIKLLLGSKDSNGRYHLVKNGRRNYHAHILAITFTKKATQEMKERILKELNLLSGMSSNEKSDHEDGLCIELNTTPEDLQKAADKALKEILYDYTNFNVNTIDSFFQQILRTFAHEVEIPFNYDVELNDKYVVNIGVKSFLSDVITNHNVSRHVKQWLKEYIRNEMEEDRDWNIFKSVENERTGSLCSFANILNNEDFKQLHLELEDYLDDYTPANGTGSFKNISSFKQAIAQQMDAERKQCINVLKQIVSTINSIGIEWDEFSKNGGLIWLVNMVKCDPALNDVVINDIDLEKVEKSQSKANSWLLKKFAQKLNQNDAFTIINLLQQVLEGKRKYEQYKGIHKNIYTLGLLGQISKKITSYRNDNKLILLSDTNEILERIINDSDVPFIYDRIGVWLNHYLIDEFQDTSQMQWRNLKPLLHQSEGSGNDNLIIGDEKQSIYRFRNSDFSLLQTGVQREFNLNNGPIKYSTNWRSASNIVRFNNTFFSIIAQTLAATDVYKTLLQYPCYKASLPEGFVKVSYLPKTTTQADPMTGEDVKIDFSQQVLSQLPSLINSILRRGYSQSDIAILVNRNSEGSDVIEALLDYNKTCKDEKDHIKVVSSDSLLLNNSSSVKLIINSLRFLNSKAQETENSGKVHSKYQSRLKREERLHWVLKEYEKRINAGAAPGTALVESFEDKATNDDYQQAVDTIFSSSAESLSLVAVTERIIDTALSQEAKVKDNAFIQAFQDEVIKYNSRPSASLRGFLRWWDNGGNSISITSPDGENAVNILTIHKSKGLEYKCVILPFCNWDIGPYPKDSMFWVKKRDIVIDKNSFWDKNKDIIPPIFPIVDSKATNLESSPFSDAYMQEVKKRIIDDLNKTYVAFTRAENELYIFAPLASQNSKAPLKYSINRLLYSFVDSATAEKADALKKETAAEKEMGAALSITDNVLILGTEPTIERKTDDDSSISKIEMPPYNVVDGLHRITFTIPDVFEPQQREQGIKLHKILSRIRSIKDIGYAFLWARGKHILTEEEHDEYLPKIEKSFKNDTVKDWFNPKNKVYNERSLVGRKDIFRPDRLITTPDGRVIVIDFKFGSENKKYHKQVKNYMAIISGILSHPMVEGYIWYPLDSKIEKVE